MLNITITKNRYGSLFAYDDIFPAYPLFQFEYRETEGMGGPAWYFWLRGDYDPDIFRVPKKDFPMDFFTAACCAKSFIRNGATMEREITIVKGSSLLKR